MKRPLGRARCLIGQEEPLRAAVPTTTTPSLSPRPLQEDDEVPERQPGADVAAGTAYSYGKD